MRWAGVRPCPLDGKRLCYSPLPALGVLTQELAPCPGTWYEL